MLRASKSQHTEQCTRGHYEGCRCRLNPSEAAWIVGIAVGSSTWWATSVGRNLRSTKDQWVETTTWSDCAHPPPSDPRGPRWATESGVCKWLPILTASCAARSGPRPRGNPREPLQVARFPTSEQVKRDEWRPGIQASSCNFENMLILAASDNSTHIWCTAAGPK